MNKKNTVTFLLSCLVLSGCTGHYDNKEDPYESFNRGSYRINDAIDRAILKPAAKGYTTLFPKIVRKGIGNSIRNVNNLPILASDLFQFKFEKAAETTSRFMFNTTFGVLGFLDLTDAFKLPKPRPNDLGMTLAYYGWKDSGYIVIPFLGPATVRDGVGRVGDAFLVPSYYIKSMSYRSLDYGVRAVNLRADLLEVEAAAENAAFDKYIFQRESYVQYRKNQLNKEGITNEETYNTPSVKEILEESGGE